MRMLTILLALVSGCALASIASATTLMRVELPRLTDAAELIIYAKCVDRESRWENGSVWSFVDFRIIETLKGAMVAGEKIRVRLAGGQVGHLQTRIDGVPEFFMGEEAVVFLERTAAGDYGVTGWTQGTFRVSRDAKGRLTVTQESSEFPTFDRSTRRFSQDGIRNMDLNEFREKVKGFLKK